MFRSRNINRWLERIDAEPGLNLCMLDSLAKKLKENPSDKLVTGY